MKTLLNYDEDLKCDEDNYIQMHRIHKFPPKTKDGLYIIDSRKNKDEQKNYLSDEVKEKIKQFDDNLSFPEFIIEKEVEKTQKPKDIHKKKDKNNKNTKGIKKSPNHLRKMPFHPDKKINKIIKEKFNSLKIKKMSNDIDFVDMLLQCYKGYIHYNVDEGQFDWYTGKYWKYDNEYTVYNFVAKYVYEINRTLRKSNADKSTLKQSSLYGNDRYIKNLLGMLKTRCVCHSEDFDKYPYLLNVHNGTVNLLTKKLQEHKPEDGITKFINVDYKSDAIGSRFPDFILEICDNDKELAKYLQVVYGYAITGETREQCIFIEKGYNKSAAKGADGTYNRHKYKADDEIIRIPDGTPQIISQKDFDKVQIKLKQRQRKTATYKAKHEYLLTGKIQCGICGSIYVGNARKANKTHPEYVSYRCSRKNGSLKCTNKEIRKDIIENIVLSRLADYFFDESVLNDLSKAYNEYIDSQDTSLNRRIQGIECDISDINKQINNIVNVVAQTGSTALTDKLRELEREKAEKSSVLSSLQEQLHSEKIDDNSLKQAFQKAKNMLKNGNLATQKLIVNTYVNCVKLYPDKIEIVFNLMPNYTVKDTLSKKKISA